MLPKEFIEYTSHLFGDERWQAYLDSFHQTVPVSIRINPFKRSEHLIADAEQIPWCREGYWLRQRPQFTRDPLLHAGTYYVQEAGSMFLDEVLRQHLTDEPIVALDLCAAPGGKSTLMRAALPKGSVLFSNEPDRKRSNILMENIQKQGHPDVYVTKNFPRDYQKARLKFDLIVTDVPCSGEGMFRKDQDTIEEWSVQNVRKCAELQRSILQDIWDCLRPGGMLIYSTCTFNTYEDEENVQWIAEHLGADILNVEIKDEWHVTGSLLQGFDAPVYRFIPGVSKSEGLFMAVLRKHGQSASAPLPQEKQLRCLNILSDGHPTGEIKGKTIIPEHAQALSLDLDAEKYPQVELSEDDALRYLHREAIVLPDSTPRGFVVVKYKNHPLGFVKNLGTRANNLYPKEWSIKHL